ncbi:hypothetical protein EZV62_001875 [Acer yangbiense]|uniref:Uncharacterized protein n=1 Tax=Acer yangbiense TaxID=1000413 RepID=A0A5C7IXW8_9ROSI|nr:hypothetical protein EZV62_001875 [Acer yangbiense]
MEVAGNFMLKEACDFLVDFEGGWRTSGRRLLTYTKKANGHHEEEKEWYQNFGGVVPTAGEQDQIPLVVEASNLEVSTGEVGISNKVPDSSCKEIRKVKALLSQQKILKAIEGPEKLHESLTEE